MDASAPAKKFPWKIVIIAVLIVGVVITSVFFARKAKKNSMIEKIITSGTSITEDILRSMSYADIKKLYDSTIQVS